MFSGEAIPNSPRIQIEEALLHTHMAIFGGTRRGKSKLFELIGRQLIDQERGFAFIDPHSDTADDLFAYLAYSKNELGYRAKNIHYINPHEKLFAYDPFHYEPDPNDPISMTRQGYYEWLYAKCLDLSAIITRGLGETEAEASKQVRLQRWIGAVLYAIGIRDESTDKHLGLAEALILLDPSDERFTSVFRIVEGRLDTHSQGIDVLNRLRLLKSVKDPIRREGWVESTINRIQRVVSPILRNIFNPRAERIDFRKIVASGGIILAALGKTRRFHQSEGRIVGGLIIRELTDAVMSIRREERRRFYLMIDEAQNYIGEDLMHLLKESGKYRFTLGLAMQSLDNLKHGEIDLTETVLGQCDIRITFQQKYKPIAEELAESLAYRLLDFTPLIHEVQRHAGYDFIVTPSFGRSAGETESHGTSEGASIGTSTGYTEGTSYGWSEGSGSSVGSNVSQSTHIPGGDGNPSSTFGDGTSAVESVNRGTTGGTTSQRSTVNSTGTNTTKSSSEGKSRSSSVTLSVSPIAKYELVEQRTGSLTRSLDWQVSELTNAFQRLPPQHCFLAVDPLGLASFVRIADVIDPFSLRGDSAEEKAHAIKIFKEFIYETHGYFFDRSEETEMLADYTLRFRNASDEPLDSSMSGPFEL
ncbi:type IV secretory system conjugative DNA transfer family protein [Aporhodopirellula rubra]|nr:TraM recognition domain-containing protein [Aporhodopirellula rubra]